MKRSFAFLRKWDYARRCYVPFLSPAGSDAMLNGNDGDICRCAECGAKMRYGDCFTSIRIHNALGFGYAVCRDCNKKEWEERRRWEKR